MSALPALGTISERLFHSADVDERRASLIKASYAFLMLSILGAVAGGYLGMRVPWLARFLTTLPGYFTALVLINLTPALALFAAKRGTGFGIAALILDGFLSGIALTPLLLLGAARAPGAIELAGILTGASLGVVTVMVLLTRQRFHAIGATLGTLGVVLLVACVLTSLWSVPILGVVLSVAITLLGALQLIYGTGEILNDQKFDQPVWGSLMLFAGLFNIFNSILSLLFSLVGRDSD